MRLASPDLSFCFPDTLPSWYFRPGSASGPSCAGPAAAPDAGAALLPADNLFCLVTSCRN